MQWTRADDAEISELDYRVQAVKCAGAWRFVAWGPDKGDIRSLMRMRYAVGEAVPGRRACLGVFDRAADARSACAEHAAGPS